MLSPNFFTRRSYLNHSYSIFPKQRKKESAELQYMIFEKSNKAENEKKS